MSDDTTRRQELSQESQDFMEELSGIVQLGFRGALCYVVVTNAAPPEWQVTIIGAATRFYYQNADGTTEGTPTDDIKNGINISSGGSVTMQTFNPARCVSLVEVILFVRVPEEPDPVVLSTSADTGPGECMAFQPVTLGPTAIVQFDKLESRSISDRLEVAVVNPRLY